MSSKEPQLPSLLSKVAKFVRNPTTSWTDLDKQDPEPDAGYSKQALKEMIERKRQNDFVRKREFDQLRKLRNRDPSANAELAGRPSYFQSSLPTNPGERALTIKKIDEIEAQMSNQWWQGKGVAGTKPAAAPAPAPTPVQGARTGAPDSADVIDDLAYAPTRLSPMRPSASLSGNETSDFPPTQDNSDFGPQDRDGPHTADAAAAPAPASSRFGDGSGFTHSRTPVIELVGGMTDGEMEEAAIRFANGDEAGAEAALLEALKHPSAGHEQALRWACALLDLYRATGRQQAFEQAAIAFAQRFERSAPVWFSMPEALEGTQAVTAARTVPSRLLVEPIWASPANVDATAVDTLRLAVANVDPPWFLDWTALERIDPQAVPALGELFAQWCETAVDLRFSGAGRLQATLHDLAHSGRREAGQVSWKLRLDALRIMQLQDAFELAALDYCVTFEVSPPAWEDARCLYHDATIAGTLTVQADATPDDDTAMRGAHGFAPAATIPMGLEPVQASVAELSGTILGEATTALAALEQARSGALRLIVSCANLVRVDFSAAGSILNWVAGLQAQGCQVQFREVHHLVAAFFGVIGINEHARVMLRPN